MWFCSGVRWLDSAFARPSLMGRNSERRQAAALQIETLHELKNLGHCPTIGTFLNRISNYWNFARAGWEVPCPLCDLRASEVKSPRFPPKESLKRAKRMALYNV